MAGQISMNFAWDTVSILNEGINSVVTSKSNPYRWFVMCKCKTSAIKFAMAGSQDCWWQFPPSLVYLFYSL